MIRREVGSARLRSDLSVAGLMVLGAMAIALMASRAIELSAVRHMKAVPARSSFTLSNSVNYLTTEGNITMESRVTDVHTINGYLEPGDTLTYYSVLPPWRILYTIKEDGTCDPGLFPCPLEH